MNKDDIELIREAIRFSVWAAGEGICPLSDEANGPEDFLFNYACRTGDEDWDRFPDKVIARLQEQLEAVNELFSPVTAKECTHYIQTIKNLEAEIRALKEKK